MPCTSWERRGNPIHLRSRVHCGVHSIKCVCLHVCVCVCKRKKVLCVCCDVMLFVFPHLASWTMFCGDEAFMNSTCRSGVGLKTNFYTKKQKQFCQNKKKKPLKEQKISLRRRKTTNENFAVARFVAILSRIRVIFADLATCRQNPATYSVRTKNRRD